MHSTCPLTTDLSNKHNIVQVIGRPLEDSGKFSQAHLEAGSSPYFVKRRNLRHMTRVWMTTSSLQRFGETSSWPQPRSIWRVLKWMKFWRGLRRGGSREPQVPSPPAPSWPVSCSSSRTWSTLTSHHLGGAWNRGNRSKSHSASPTVLSGNIKCSCSSESCPPSLSGLSWKVTMKVYFKYSL